jgi:hypothetical protein
MKYYSTVNNTISLMLMIVVCSCGNSPQEISILNQEQVIDGIKTDLSMDIKSLEKVGIVKYGDSTKVLSELIQKQATEKILHLLDRSTKYLYEKREYEFTLIVAKTKERKDHAKKTITMLGEWIADNRKRIDNLKEGKYSLTPLAPIAARLERYKASPDSVFAEKYICTYTIKNPLLNNVTQEMTKEYILSLDGTKVFASIIK